MQNSNDLYATITQKIITDLEKGNLTWRKPWSAENLAGNVMLPLRWNGIPYSGINTILLWATSCEKNYTTPYWMTFKQTTDLKARVRKGEKGTTVVYAEKFMREHIKNDGSKDLKEASILKRYIVFNVCQLEGLSDDFYKAPEKKMVNTDDRIAEVGFFFDRTNARIFGGAKAAYYEGLDAIEMPPFDCFKSVGDYYATLAHETVHWTKHKTRLQRDFNRNKWGDEGYAKEELVAELGACFLGAMLGFAPVMKDQHAAYIQSWVKVLKNDTKFIFQAASYAQRAVEYLSVCQNTKEDQATVKAALSQS